MLKLSLALMAICLLLPCSSPAREKRTPWVSDTPKPISLVPPPNEPNVDVKEKELFDKTQAVVYRAHAKDLIWLTMGNCANGRKDREGRPTIAKCKSDEKSDFPGPKDYIVI